MKTVENRAGNLATQTARSHQTPKTSLSAIITILAATFYTNACGAPDIDQLEPAAMGPAAWMLSATLERGTITDLIDTWGDHHAAVQWLMPRPQDGGRNPGAWRRPYSARLWRRLYQAYCEMPDDNRDTSEHALCHVPADNSLELDNMVLDVLYSSSGQRLAGGGFLEMTALALSGIMERISALAELHGLAESLNASPPRSHLEVEQMVDMIASIADKNALGQAISNAHAVRQEWMAGFRAMHEHHRRLEVAVQVATKSAGYSVDWADALTLPIGSPEQELASLVSTAKAWQSSRRSMRRVAGASPPEIAGGLDDARLDVWLTEATIKLSTLEQQLTRYREERHELLRLARQNLHTDQVSVQLDYRRRRLSEEMRTAAQKQDDLEEVMAERQASLSNFEQAFQVRSGASGQGSMRRLRRGPEQVLSLSAADVPNGLPGTPLSYAVGQSMAVKMGDWIEVSAYGQWSMTHALRMTDSSLTNSLAGPGGFDIFVNESEFQGHTTGEQTNDFTSDICSRENHHSAGVEASAGFMVWGNGVQARTSVGQRSSRTRAHGHTDTRTSQQQDGQERRTGKTFRLPLCSPHTPFPELPAGSLVMVQVENGELMAKAVVSGLHTTRAQVDGEIFFIINDASPRTQEADAGHRVSVRASVSYSTAETESAVHAAMGAVLARLSTRLDNSSSSSPLIESREEVWAWATQCLAERGVEYLELPDSWRDFFFSWVLKHHAQFDKQVALTEVQKNMRLLWIEEDGLRREAQTVADQRTLTRTEAIWLQQNFDIEYLRGGVRSVTSFLGQTLIPYVRLTDASFLTSGFSRDNQLLLASDKMMRLPSKGASEASRCDFGTNAEGLIHFGRLVVDMVRTQRAIRPPSHEQVVRIVIPRGGLPLEQAPRYSGCVIDEDRAASFWRAVEDHRDASLNIGLGDLYTSHSTHQGTLRERCELPIVRHMALFFDTGTNLHFEALNAAQITIETEISPHVTFALASGNVDYVLRGESWRFFGLPVLTGPKERLLTEFKNWQGGIGQSHRIHGTTPFGQYHINFSDKVPDLDLILQHTEAVVMVMSLEVRPCGGKVRFYEN